MIIIYKSKTGFTKRYADVLQRKLNCKCIPICDMKHMDLSKENLVIYGARIHAGRIDGLKKIKKLKRKGSISSLLVFVTGGTPNLAKDVIDTVWKKNFTEEELEQIPHFYMQSGICYEKMGFLDKTLMKLAAKLMGTKKNKTDTEDGFIKSISKSYDISSETYATPVVEYVEKGRK